MKSIQSLILSLVIAMLTLYSALAEAHPPGRGGWHGGVGVYFGAPYPFFPYPYGPYAYPYPYVYNPPPVVVTPAQPQVYIEQGSTQAPAQTTPPSTSTGNANANYWYYCEAADGYYPYVKECPAGWKQVTPTPPPAATAR